MGRLLEIARSLPVTAAEPKLSRPTCAVSAKSAVSLSLTYQVPTHQESPLKLPAFDPAASAVLGILVRAGQPVPHPAIVAALAEQGYDKAAARKAIASCQGKRWIEHNLTTGYILTEGCAIKNPL